MKNQIDYTKVVNKIYEYNHSFNSIAKKLNVYPMTLKRILSNNFGKRDPDIEKSLLEKIANILEISYDKLIS